MMKRLGLAIAVLGVWLAVVLLARLRPPAPLPVETPAGLQIQAEGRDPWTHLRFNNASSTFRFAIVTDRTGGPRPGVFERAVDRLNWLQPEFVVCVGDLIQGDTADGRAVRREWEEFAGWVAKLEMPFFYVPGNHDLGNATLGRIWHERFGRRYYHFIYKGVLFLTLDTEDRNGKGVVFSPEQLAYVHRVLREQRRARWTIVLLHRPIWSYANAGQTAWSEVERALAGRRFTVFSGHKHRYECFERNGQRYYILATTGGRSGLRGPAYGEFDHVVWVTMKPKGPVLANLLLDGILPENLLLGKRQRQGK